MREIKPNTFIFEFKNALSKEDCKSIIQRFEENKEEHHVGKIGQNLTENQNIKNLLIFLLVVKKPGETLIKCYLMH